MTGKGQQSKNQANNDLTITQLSLGEPGEIALFDKNLDAKLLATLVYVPLAPLNLVLAVLVFMSPADNSQYARFHAVQAAVLTGAFLALSMLMAVATTLLGVLPFLNILAGLTAMVLQPVLWLAYCVISCKLAYDVHQRRTTILPYAGKIALDWSKSSS